MAIEFIEVTDIKLNVIHRVNVSHIISFVEEVEKDGGTLLLLSYKYTLKVKETPDQILSKMKELQGEKG